MVLVAAGLFFGSAILTLLILLATGGLSPGRRSAPVASEARAPTAAPGSVGLSDLLLEPPNWPIGVSVGKDPAGVLAGEAAGDLKEAQAAGQAPPYLLREPLAHWSDQQIARYWVPLEEIAVDQIRKENDRRIERFFEEVP